MRTLRIIIILLIVVFIPLHGQNDYPKEYITMAPGEQYAAGWFHRLVFGDHWRDVWTTPIQVEILDLGNFDGSLTPIKRGGGMQTKSLRLLSGNNRIWKFRSMDKDPAKILPKVMQKTIAADVLQDQISSANPLAPLVVAPILDAVGVMQSRPYMCYMPDDERLGEFRGEFGGLLGMMEIHPKVDEDEGLEFEGAEKVIGTLDLFDRLADKHSEHYDSKAYLTARLIDIFLGDWDRHTDQWKWAKNTFNGVEYWEPIPRDRDQAFAKFDGLGVRIAEYLIPQFNDFGYDYPQIEDITWSGRFIDRRVLPVLTKSEWDSITVYVQSKLTDEVIEKAVKVLPDADYKISADELISKMKSRRDKLFKISDEFYEFVNDVVDVYCSEDEDYIYLNRLSNDFTELYVYRRDEDNNIDEHELYYYKKFDNALTSEIRIYAMDKDDKIRLAGEVDDSPLVRVIGGDGGDRVIDESVVNGYLLGFIPIPDAENKTRVYDSGKKTKIDFASGTIYDDTKFKEPKGQLEKYEPQQRDRHADWLIKPVVSLSSDNGLIIGGGPQLTKYNFRAVPYEYRMSLSAYYASKPGMGTLEYNGRFNSLVSGVGVNVNLLATGLTLTNYYGFGNETDYSHDLEEIDYYELEQGLFQFGATLEFGLFDDAYIIAGAEYKYSDIELHQSSLLNSFHTYYGGNYGIGIHESIKSLVEFKYDRRDNQYNTFKGYYLSVDASVTPKVLDNREIHGSVEFDFRSYNHIKTFTDLIIASRVGGGKTFGNYPFYDAQFLGGGSNLRGYNRERFSGDAVLFGQLELRVLLDEVRIIIPGNLGFHSFIESGRVFVRDDDSKVWHPSYGGGLWLSYLDRMFNLSLTVGHSPDGFSFWAGTGMMF